MRKMTREESFAFLLARPRTAKLATVRPDGRPHVAPIWIDLDGEQIVFTTWHESVKARNLLHNPQASLIVDDEAPPFAFVKVDGVVTFSHDLVALRLWATRIAARYMGPEQADAYGRRNAVEGEWLARISPTSVLGQDDVAGW